MRISIVIPCYNEGSGIKDTYEKLSEVLKYYEYNYELIFVDDGSKDNTIDEIEKISARDSNCKYISFSRNFGKESGMLAGLRYSNGDVVVIIDADLQHPPELIPTMVKCFYEGYDQVIAKRNRKGDSRTRTLVSKLYYKLVNKMIDVSLEDGVGDFRLLSRQAVNALVSLGEYNRFSKGLFSWIGFKSKVIEYENKQRKAGESKWNFKSLLNYGIDGIISFNNRPLRYILYMGIIIVIISLLYVILTFIKIISNGIDQPGYFTTISAILMIGGIQLISVGVIGEYIGRIYYEVKKRPNYIVKKSNIFEESIGIEEYDRKAF